jgi:DNA-directed RNA polymerase specialized sigma24 family protein
MIPVDDRLDLSQAIRCLDDYDVTVLYLYAQGYKMAELGEMLHCTRWTAARMVRKAMDKLKLTMDIHQN